VNEVKEKCETVLWEIFED